MNKQRIPPVDPATAIGANKKNFDILKSALGFIPNMALAMAQSPAVLDGYMGLSGALIKGRLGKRLGEELALTLAGTNRCEYCASAHSTTAKIAGLDEADVVAALQGESEEVREAARLRARRGLLMPLVRIDLIQGKSSDYKGAIGEVIYGAMLAILNVPKNDRFQVITEHPVEGFLFDPTYLDIQRSSDCIFIQLTLNEGRTVEHKQRFYKAVADDLHRRLSLRREDVFISLVEVTKENWSFGNGEAQYVTAPQ